FSFASWRIRGTRKGAQVREHWAVVCPASQTLPTTGAVAQVPRPEGPAARTPHDRAPPTSPLARHLFCAPPPRHLQILPQPPRPRVLRPQRPLRPRQRRGKQLSRLRPPPLRPERKAEIVHRPQRALVIRPQRPLEPARRLREISLRIRLTP